MEERLIDKDDPRLIKIKHTAEGDDVVDPLAPGEGEEELSAEEADYIVELPEDAEESYDEDLVGLTPSQLKARLEEKQRAEERARAEYQKLMDEAAALLEKGDYEQAEPLFAQATLYESDAVMARRGLWVCRTKNFTDIGTFMDHDAAQEFYWTDETVRKETLQKLGDRIREKKRELEEEARPLRTQYEAEKAERAEAFKANRKYYFIRSLIVLAVAFALAIGAVVSATYILRRSDSLALIFTIVLGVLAFAMLVLFLIYAMKTVNAGRMCRANEQMTSTEGGVRLKELEDRIVSLSFVLDERDEDEEPDRDEKE